MEIGLLVANMMALQVSLVASNKSVTTPGLGNLIYRVPGEDPLNDMTIQQISDQISTDMTNWGGVQYATFAHYNDVLTKILAAFASPSLNLVASDTAHGWAQALIQVVLTNPVSLADVPFLHQNVGATIQHSPLAAYNPPIPVKFGLQQNYPNPFNPGTTIATDLPFDAFVTLKIYNILGQPVATIYNHRFIAAGTDYSDFDATHLASGVYIYRVEAQQVGNDGTASGKVYTDVKKMMYVK